MTLWRTTAMTVQDWIAVRHLLQLRKDAGAASDNTRQAHQRIQVVLPARHVADPPLRAPFPRGELGSRRL